MKNPPAARGIALLLVALPFSFAGKCKKEADTVETTDDAPADPQVRVQVISVDPDQVDPGKAFRGIVFGSAFEDGARVWVGDAEIASVTWRDENTIAMSVPPLAEGAYDVKVRNPDGESATLRAGLVARAEVSPTAGLDCNLVRVTFDFDSAALGTNAQRTLERHLPCFQQGSASVRIEGHCDERGTTDYNLALGQRRADAIERWLITKGVPPSRLRVTSFGEERPLATAHDESAWTQNRRGELRVGQ